jgi:hypothetical protein
MKAVRNRGIDDARRAGSRIRPFFLKSDKMAASGTFRSERMRVSLPE